MSNHPNRGPKGPASNPSPALVKAARAATGLTQTQAAAVVYCTIKAWQTWEDGTRRMPPGLWELFGIKTGYVADAEKDMGNTLETLLDTIIEEHPRLTDKSHRAYLAAIARGIRLMRRYGVNGGWDVPKPGPGFDEWVAANDHYAAACNKIREAVGEQETRIARRIREFEAHVVS